MAMDARQSIRLTDAEARSVLDDGVKLQLATINPDGTPHLVTMYYALIDGQIAFWTYRTSQKARNIERDPRVTCLVEAGEAYFDLRGVQINGIARPVLEPLAIADVGSRVVARSMGLPVDDLTEHVTHAARKRLAYLIEPIRYASWDHRKLTATR